MGSLRGWHVASSTCPCLIIYHATSWCGVLLAFRLASTLAIKYSGIQLHQRLHLCVLAWCDHVVRVCWHQIPKGFGVVCYINACRWKRKGTKAYEWQHPVGWTKVFSLLRSNWTKVVILVPIGPKFCKGVTFWYQHNTYLLKMHHALITCNLSLDNALHTLSAQTH